MPAPEQHSSAHAARAATRPGHEDAIHGARNTGQCRDDDGENRHDQGEHCQRQVRQQPSAASQRSPGQRLPGTGRNQ